MKWQRLGLAAVLLGTGGLVGLQEEGREGVDLVRPPHLVGQQRQLHNVEVFVQVFHLWPGHRADGGGQGVAGQGQMWVNGRDQAGDLPGSGENVGQGLHMPIAGSETSEVRDHWAGLPPPWGQRYPGQASYCLQEPESG